MVVKINYFNQAKFAYFQQTNLKVSDCKTGNATKIQLPSKILSKNNI